MTRWRRIRIRGKVASRGGRISALGIGAALAVLAFQGCGEGPQVMITQPNTSSPFLGASGSNVLPIHVGPSAGSVCGQMGYGNEPCTSVTICVPGTQQCQVLTDILVDTGSVGLRVFQSVIQLPLPLILDGSGHPYAECAQFGTGSDWGPLVQAGLVLSGEPAITLPIQLINQSFAPAPSGCADGDTGPQEAGYNGILGLGVFAQDCGADCAADPSNKVYFDCSTTGPSGSCQSVTMPLSDQLQNPVSGLPTDNNGLLIAMPQADFRGSHDLTGVLILGIGTRANNAPTQVHAYLTDDLGTFTTVMEGRAYPGSFIDSGSNGLFFPNDVGLPLCPSSGPANQFYCPSQVQSLTATNLSYGGNSEAQITFGIGNGEALLNSGNFAFPDLGGNVTSLFDWGMPFFYGRAVFEGIEGQSSPIGYGHYMAY